jgi:pre-mRNA-splicing factor ATP-dependent RNA helicase DHX38/PRP16
VVRDPNSDFAVLAKKGSHVLKYVRERADRQTMRDKFWEISGTKLGNILKAPSAAATAVIGNKEEGDKEKA